jgi:peptide chain release factor subunit 3
MLDKKTGKKSKNAPKFVRQGDACIARLECQQPICLETYEEYQQLGRFTLRDEGFNLSSF